MNTYPLVSIIIPLYNGSNYVEEAISCALNQTYKNIEIIVVNDGSTDGGLGREVCQKYQDKIVYVEKENGGCASALNFGIRLAKGEYISWLSHDDLYNNDKIEKQILQYDKYRLDKQNTIISNSAKLITANGRKLYHPQKKAKGFFSSKKAYQYLLHKKCLNGCGLLIPKSVFEKAGYFDESLRFVLDWNLWLKFAIAGVDFYLDNEILVSNRCHNAQVTTTQKSLHQKETLQTIEELFSLLKTKQDRFFLAELYYFCYSTNRELAKDIKHYCKGNVKLRKSRAWRLKCGVKIRSELKKIYHKFR